MNELGIAPHVVEAVVNHVSGRAKAGVAGVYNRAVYAAREAGGAAGLGRSSGRGARAGRAQGHPDAGVMAALTWPAPPHPWGRAPRRSPVPRRADGPMQAHAFPISSGSHPCAVSALSIGSHPRPASARLMGPICDRKPIALLVPSEPCILRLPRCHRARALLDCPPARLGSHEPNTGTAPGCRAFPSLRAPIAEVPAMMGRRGSRVVPVLGS